MKHNVLNFGYVKFEINAENFTGKVAVRKTPILEEVIQIDRWQLLNLFWTLQDAKLEAMRKDPDEWARSLIDLYHVENENKVLEDEYGKQE